MAGKTKTKEEVYFAVCNSILKFEVSKGHMKWTLSDISRDSKITRSLIYYYFGKDKKSILEESYKFISSIFFSVDADKTVGVKARIKQVLQDLQSMPYLFVLYYLQKNKKTEFGTLIRESEKTFLKSFKRDYPKLSDQEIQKVYLLELGAIAFQLPVDQADEVFKDFDLNKK